LSQKEFQRAKVIENAGAGRTTVDEASGLLRLSRKQDYRLKACYRPEELDWVRHGHCGKRKPQAGMMVLADATREDWLEGRGPRLTLVGFQDDATGRVLAAGFQQEPKDTVGWLRQLRSMVSRHGSFQRNDKHWILEEELAGRQGPPQLGRVLEELGIEQIAALSP